jgi:hypothetical protein
MMTKNGPLAPPEGQPVELAMPMERDTLVMSAVMVVSTAPPDPSLRSKAIV